MRTVPANCRHCDKVFQRPFRRGGTQRFCSEKCRARFRYLRFNDRPEKPCRHCGGTIPAGSHSNRDYCSRTCKKAVDAAVSKVTYPTKYVFRRYQRQCAVCSVDYVARKPHGKFCSGVCAHRHHMTRPEFRARVRQFSDSRKALRRGAERALGFSALEILERDGWTCRICGIQTPKELRGTTHKNAPELDHIVPLSRGGEHTPENTRCLCMKCNRAKSDKVAA